MTTETLDYPIFQTSTADVTVRGGVAKPTVANSSKAKDFDLTQAAAKGDMAAFEEIYHRHHRRVYSICLRMLQNAFEA